MKNGVKRLTFHLDDLGLEVTVPFVDVDMSTDPREGCFSIAPNRERDLKAFRKAVAFFILATETHCVYKAVDEEGLETFLISNTGIQHLSWDDRELVVEFSVEKTQEEKEAEALEELSDHMDDFFAEILNIPNLPSHYKSIIHERVTNSL